LEQIFAEFASVREPVAAGLRRYRDAARLNAFRLPTSTGSHFILIAWLPQDHTQSPSPWQSAARSSEAAS
jgi:hypothetical protein